MAFRRCNQTAATILLFCVALVLPSAQSTSAPPDLDAYVARVMTTFEVPGLALSVVKDGQVVVAKGFGVRRKGDPAAVDAHTLFGIASNTKVVMATALGLLVEDGKIEWDAPVIRYLPWFQMSDPFVTRELTVRDLLVHRSGLGLGAGDLLWWPPSTGDPAPELAALKPNFRGYALGLGVSDYRGRKVLSHTGGLPGYVSKVMLLPDLNVGVAVLTNQESGDAFESIVYRVADHYLGLPQTDWVDAYRRLRDRRQAAFAEAERKAVQARDSSSRPSLPLSKYAGTYRDQWYGDIAIELQGEKLVMRFTRTPSLAGDLEHWQHDTFIARWHDRELRADAYVTFALNPDGTIDQAKMAAVSPSTDFSFDFQDLLLKPVE